MTDDAPDQPRYDVDMAIDPPWKDYLQLLSLIHI